MNWSKVKLGKTGPAAVDRVHRDGLDGFAMVTHKLRQGLTASGKRHPRLVPGGHSAA